MLSRTQVMLSSTQVMLSSTQLLSWGPHAAVVKFGKHAAFRSPCPYGLGGSSPLSRITLKISDAAPSALPTHR